MTGSRGHNGVTDAQRERMKRARTDTARLEELFRLIVTRIELDLRTGRLPPNWGADVMQEARELAKALREQSQ